LRAEKFEYVVSRFRNGQRRLSNDRMAPTALMDGSCFGIGSNRRESIRTGLLPRKLVGEQLQKNLPPRLVGGLFEAFPEMSDVLVVDEFADRVSLGRCFLYLSTCPALKHGFPPHAQPLG
jgi:hypothetical protein